MRKEKLFREREIFFKSILDWLQKDPTKIDKILMQDEYFIKPNKELSYYDEVSGDLAICINGNFHGIDFKIWYSLWQYSTTLRIGIALYDDDFQGMLVEDDYKETHTIWGENTEPRIDVAHGGVLYEWNFEVPKLYKGFEHQEKFIIGIRHMHFRIMRIMSDACYKIKLRNEEGKK